MKKLIFTILLILALAVPGWGATETFYLRASGDASAPETLGGAFDASDFNNAGNWDTDDQDDGKIGPNDDVLFYDDDGVIRAQLTVQQSGLSGKPITIKKGIGESPVILGTDTVSSWTQHDATAAYYATLATAPQKVFENPSNSADNTPYTEGSSIQDVIDNASYWYHTGTTLYVHASDSADPDTHTIEATQRDYGLTGASKDYITVDGLTIARVELVGIYDDQGDSWEIKNNEIRNYGEGTSTPNAGIKVRGDPTGATQITGILIHGNTVGRGDGDNTAYSSDRQGIICFGTSAAQIYRNYVATVNLPAFKADTGNGAGGGAASTSGLFYENEITNCETGPEWSNSDNWKAYYNYSHDSYGIAYGINWGSDNFEGYYNIAYNVTTSPGMGRYNGFDINANADGGVLYGNSVVKCDGVLLTIEDYSSGADNWVIKNNILDKRGSDDNTCIQIFYDCSNITLENNLYIVKPTYSYGWRLEVTDGNFTLYDAYATWETAAETAGHSLDSEFVETDPKFADVDNGDLTLQPTSPCINVGTDLGSSYDDALHGVSVWLDNIQTVDQDLQGTGWEIGAYIHDVSIGRGISGGS